MKKIVLVFSILAVCLSFVACAKDPVVKIKDVTVEGTEGADIEETEVVLNFENDSLAKAIEAGTDGVEGWIKNINGLTATAKAAEANAKSVTIKLSGKPTAASDEQIDLDVAKIKAALKSGKDVKFTKNDKAVFAIAADKTASGKVEGKVTVYAGETIASTTDQSATATAVVTLKNVTLKSGATFDNVVSYADAPASGAQGFTVTAADGKLKIKAADGAVGATAIKKAWKITLTKDTHFTVNEGCTLEGTTLVINGDTTNNYFEIAELTEAKIEYSGSITSTVGTTAVSGTITATITGATTSDAANLFTKESSSKVKYTVTADTAKKVLTITGSYDGSNAFVETAAAPFATAVDDSKLTLDRGYKEPDDGWQKPTSEKGFVKVNAAG